jgi:hypothetical protein
VPFWELFTEVNSSFDKSRGLTASMSSSGRIGVDVGMLTSLWCGMSSVETKGSEKGSSQPNGVGKLTSCRTIRYMQHDEWATRGLPLETVKDRPMVTREVSDDLL